MPDGELVGAGAREAIGRAEEEAAPFPFPLPLEPEGMPPRRSDIGAYSSTGSSVKAFGPRSASSKV